MKVFMLGWEFPPHISGGLGTACHGLTKGLDELGVEVSFVLPTSVPVSQAGNVNLRSPTTLAQLADAVGGINDETTVNQHGAVLDVSQHPFEHVELHQVSAMLQPYANPETSESIMQVLREQRCKLLANTETDNADSETGQEEETSDDIDCGQPDNYEGDLLSQIHRYARLSVELAKRESFDVVHAHDWMTFPAGQAVAAATGKPLIVHVHSTEFDRSGQNINQNVYDIERAGMHCARRVICVSHLTRTTVITRYGVPAEDVEVVYNAVELTNGHKFATTPIKRNEKIVLFLGRVTMQKGPEYFLQAAKKVIQKYDKVRFVIAGSGDMIEQCIRLAADLELGRYVTFTGFLQGDDVSRVFQMADLYVMPSVSEPFGIAPLEALSHDVPVIISKQSGVSEVLTHVLKVDFWDTSEMANKILAVLRHPPLQKTLRQHGQIEVTRLSWKDSASQIKNIYEKVTMG